jgi:hypothetical protein
MGHAEGIPGPVKELAQYHGIQSSADRNQQFVAGGKESFCRNKILERLKNIH